jgi:hypothetical protein
METKMAKEKTASLKYDLGNLRDLFWQAMEEAGWEPFLEDDYDDFKNIFGRRKEPLAGAFTRMELIVFNPHGDTKKLFVRFHFYADPRLRRQKEFVFNADSAIELFGDFHGFCLGALRHAGLETVKEDDVLIKRSSHYKVNFGSGEARRAACTLEAGYCF